MVTCEQAILADKPVTAVELAEQCDNREIYSMLSMLRDEILGKGRR